MVKRILRFLGIAGILGLGIASAYAFSFGEFFGMEQKETPATASKVWLYETQQHHIKMTCSHLREENIKGSIHLYADDCIYQAWKKPRTMAMGTPDLEIRDGKKFFEPAPDTDYFSFRDQNQHIVVKHEIGKPDMLEIYANNQLAKLPIRQKNTGGAE